MKSKQLRQYKIRELLQANHIQTHERMAEALQQLDIDVSQSTLSKDLRELGVLRVPRPEGGFRYALPEAGGTLRDQRILERELNDFLVGSDRAANMVVVKTAGGHAQSVCEAIDQMAWPEVMGTIAGENTILMVSRTAREAEQLAGRIAKIREQRT